MLITAAAVSLTVEDVDSSASFLADHFGFTIDVSADGFASLTRPDLGMNVAYLRRGLAVLPDDQRDEHVAGTTLAFVVDDLDSELSRLADAGVAITMPLRSEEWGERSFQVIDPNGIRIQLMDWDGAGPADDSANR
jgi:predicted enzyme related to lactoylglutathione lyase